MPELTLLLNSRVALSINEAPYHRGMDRSANSSTLDWQARALSLIDWIEKGGVIEERLDAQAFSQEMPRLYQLSVHAPRENLRWRASGLTETRLEQTDRTEGERRHWLRLEAHAQLILTCQRCMHPLTLDLHIKRRFLVAGNESAAEQMEDTSQDEYDVIAHNKKFDLLTLTEDELLLALPIVPKHQECEPPGLMQQDASGSDERPKPFAVLASLKRRGHADPES